jgi:penicillin amidase
MSLAWREARDTVLAIPGRTAEVSLALDRLRDWDGAVEVDSAAATIWELFVAEIWRRIVKARAPNAWDYALGRGFASLLPITTFAAGRGSKVIALLREQPEGWFDAGWQNEMADALTAVVTRLTSDYGSDPSGWAWGRLRTLTLRHPLGRVRRLAPLFNRGPYPWGGDGNTISQAGMTPLRHLGNPLVIASLRAVIDVGAWDASRFALPGGQSGNPFSPHYDDMLGLWQRGEGVPIAWSRQAIEAASVSCLTLSPLR